MPKSILTTRQKNFIRKHRFEMSGSAMARKFGLRDDVVGRYANGLSVPRSVWQGQHLMNIPTIF
jgi:hypothetical protein